MSRRACAARKLSSFERRATLARVLHKRRAARRFFSGEAVTLETVTYTNARAYGFDVPPPRFWPGAIGAAQVLLNPLVHALDRAGVGLQRRLRRERRRRLVGRSYDMAVEIARVLPRGASVLDVGCGSGFIAHHLAALVGADVVGIDVRRSVDAPIRYFCFDGARIPFRDSSFDAALL